MFRRLSCLVVLSALIAASCSSDGSETTESSEPSVSSTAEVSTTAAVPTVDPSIHVVTVAKGVATVTAADGTVTTIDLPKGFSPVAAPTIGRWLVEGGRNIDSELAVVDLALGTTASFDLRARWKRNRSA